MARRRRRTRRYGGPIVTIPGLNGIPGADFLKKSVNVTDAAVGAAVGIVGGAGLKAAAKKFMPDAFAPGGVGAMLGAGIPLAFGVAAGAAMYFLEGKSSRAVGHAVGSSLAGLALSVNEFAKSALAGNAYLDFSEVTQVNFGRRPYNGLLIKDDVGPGVNGYGAYNGLLVADHSDGLAGLAALSMAPDDDGIDALMGM